MGYTVYSVIITKNFRQKSLVIQNKHIEILLHFTMKLNCATQSRGLTFIFQLIHEMAAYKVYQIIILELY